MNKIFRSPGKQNLSEEMEQLIYQYFVVNSHPLMALHNDARRIMMMIPNNPEPFIAIAVNKCLRTDPFVGESEKRLAIAVLQAMLDLPFTFKETSTLFLAGCMTGNDKTVGSYATEVWMKSVMVNSIDSKRLGYILGMLMNMHH